jgi:hypothetical protein
VFLNFRDGYSDRQEDECMAHGSQRESKPQHVPRKRRKSLAWPRA